MPAVASVPKELYLCTSLKDLNKKTEIKPEKTSTKRYIYFNLFWINIGSICATFLSRFHNSYVVEVNYLLDMKSSIFLYIDLSTITYAYCLQKVA